MEPHEHFWYIDLSTAQVYAHAASMTPLVCVQCCARVKGYEVFQLRWHPTRVQHLACLQLS